MMDNPDELLINEFFVKDRQIFVQLARENKAPRVVYDIGAASGGWSGVVTAGLAAAEHHLFEPLNDHPQYSEKLKARLRRNAAWVIHPIALSDSNGTCIMSIGRNVANSTLIDMRSHPSLFSDRAEVPQWRLDDYVATRHLPLPDLVKIDTQASEHLVLAGGRRTIAAAQVLMVETWLYREYGPSTPLLTDIIALASSLGFILFKFGDEFRHQDGRLYGLDVVFTKPGLQSIADGD